MSSATQSESFGLKRAKWIKNGNRWQLLVSESDQNLGQIAHYQQDVIKNLQDKFV